jgi:hypothetical protein
MKAAQLDRLCRSRRSLSDAGRALFAVSVGPRPRHLGLSRRLQWRPGEVVAGAVEGARACPFPLLPGRRMRVKTLRILRASTWSDMAIFSLGTPRGGRGRIPALLMARRKSPLHEAGSNCSLQPACKDRKARFFGLHLVEFRGVPIPDGHAAVSDSCRSRAVVCRSKIKLLPCGHEAVSRPRSKRSGRLFPPADPQSGAQRRKESICLFTMPPQRPHLVRRGLLNGRL